MLTELQTIRNSEIVKLPYDTAQSACSGYFTVHPILCLHCTKSQPYITLDTLIALLGLIFYMKIQITGGFKDVNSQ